MAKELLYKGRKLEDIQRMNLEEFKKVVSSRARRSLKRGFTESQKKLLLKIKKYKERKITKPIKTHCRDIVIVPEMIGILFQVHNGREFVPVHVSHEMLGKYLGEFVTNRKKVSHSAPGIGATKSSAAMSVK